LDCPKCGQNVRPTANECPTCGNDFTLTPRDYRSSFIKFARRHFKLSEQLEIAIVGVAIGTVSLLLPWDSGFVWSGDTVVAQNAMNIFDLFAANDLVIVLGASLFVAGMLLFILNRWFVIFQFIGMMVLSFTMSSFMISKLPSQLDPYNNFRYETGLAIGYFLGWLSILILGTMLIVRNRRT
jgi:hypothetical protein